MLSQKLKDKLHILRVLSDSHASAIVLELLNARDAGKSPVSHKELLWLVDLNVAGAATLYWQTSIRELERLGIIELIPHDHTILYQLNPQMDPFCAELIKLLFTGENGMREKLPLPG